MARSCTPATRSANPQRNPRKKPIIVARSYPTHEVRATCATMAHMAGSKAVFLKDELTVVLGASGVYALRMLGLYMALPVMSTWAAGLPGATPFLVGLSLGAYGLTQAIFQVPFGLFGDVRG